jgi:uncharacterized protein
LAPVIYETEIEKGIRGIYNYIGGHNFAFVQENLFEKLKKEKEIKKSSKLEELIKKNFLVPLNYSNDLYLDSFKQQQKVDIHLMYLLLSQSCNLKCKYCFENLNNTEKKLMSWEVADRAIDYFFEISKENRKIIFYGGEPLLNFMVFKKSVEKIRKKDKKTKSYSEIEIVTNGTLINKEIALFCKKFNVKVAVSIDGPKDIHDSMRIYKNSKNSSFDAAIKGYQNLKEINAEPAISCTIGKHNVKILPEIAKFFVNELKPKSVGFNLIIGENEKPDVEEATNSLLEAYEILKSNNIYEDRIMRRLEPIAKNKFYLKECAAYGNQIVVRYDGKVGPCHAFCTTNQYFEDDLFNENFDVFSSRIFQEWAYRSPLNNEKCRKCPFILLCGGGCAFNAKLKKGDIHEIDENICLHTKTILNWIFKKIWEKKKSRF